MLPKQYTEAGTGREFVPQTDETLRSAGFVSIQVGHKLKGKKVVKGLVRALGQGEKVLDIIQNKDGTQPEWMNPHQGALYLSPNGKFGRGVYFAKDMDGAKAKSQGGSSHYAICNVLIGAQLSYQSAKLADKEIQAISDEFDGTIEATDEEMDGYSFKFWPGHIPEDDILTKDVGKWLYEKKKVDSLHLMTTPGAYQFPAIKQAIAKKRGWKADKTWNKNWQTAMQEYRSGTVKDFSGIMAAWGPEWAVFWADMVVVADLIEAKSGKSLLHSAHRNYYNYLPFPQYSADSDENEAMNVMDYNYAQYPQPQYAQYPQYQQYPVILPVMESSAWSVSVWYLFAAVLLMAVICCIGWIVSICGFVFGRTQRMGQKVKLMDEEQIV